MTAPAPVFGRSGDLRVRAGTSFIPVITATDRDGKPVDFTGRELFYSFYDRQTEEELLTRSAVGAGKSVSLPVVNGDDLWRLRDSASRLRLSILVGFYVEQGYVELSEGQVTIDGAPRTLVANSIDAAEEVDLTVTLPAGGLQVVMKGAPGLTPWAALGKTLVQYQGDLEQLAIDAAKIVAASAGDTAGAAAGRIAGAAAGTTAGADAGRIAGDAAGMIAGDAAGKVAGAAAGTTAGDAAGKTAGAAAGTAAGDAAGKVAGAAAGSAAAQPAITAANTAATNADTKATFADTQGKYAKAQGDAIGNIADAVATSGANAGKAAASEVAARQQVTLLRDRMDVTGAWYDLRKQVALAEVDASMRPLRIVYLSGEERALVPVPFATRTTSADTATTATRLSAGGLVIDAGERFYLMRQEVVTAEVDTNLVPRRATLLNGFYVPPVAAGVAAPVVASSLETAGFSITAPDRLYLMRRQVVRATVDPSLRAHSADLLDGTTYPPIVLPVTTPVLNPIMLAGDSLTAAATYMPTLVLLSGRDVLRTAIGGQTSRHIVGRLGAVAYRLTVDGNQLVAGSNNITAINGNAIVGMAGTPVSNVQFLSTGSGNGATSATGRLGSITGTLTRTASGGPSSTAEVYTFVPDASMAAYLPCKVPAGTPFQVDYPYDSYTHVLWLGRNNAQETAQVLSDVDAAVRRIGHNRIVIMPPPNGDYAGERSSAADPRGYNNFRTIENALAEKYPRYFLNIRRSLIDRGLAALGIAPTAQDLIDIADDTIPQSLRADNVHHTAAAQQFIAAEVNANLLARGI